VNRQGSGPMSEPGTCEHEAEELTARPQRSVRTRTLSVSSESCTSRPVKKPEYNIEECSRTHTSVCSATPRVLVWTVRA
jgi:hypothetical protein